MNFMSYEHLVEECPIILVVREMFGDCNTYNSNWRDHPNFSWKPQPPQYKQPTQAPQQASNLEQAMVNLSKVVGDFVLAQKSINAHLSQRIDSVESSLNKRMDEVQNDLSQKIQSQGGLAKMMKGKEEKREFWPLVLFPLLGHIWSTFSSPFYTYYIPFRSSGSQEFNASNGVQIGVETKKLWSLQENCTELKENFAHLNPRHGLQAMKWPPSYEMASKLQNDMQKHFAKPREIAKMPTESHNHASKEESPLTEITHEVSHSISYLPKPSKLIAPTESSS
ncbi:hypothetical protein CK203_055775 [Vitis vinifera]|uniref:Uncharacterized protein n=1 Tax=Vitis vinifera TaxID=29760 RepID=A0A438H1V4_VITVI|nr:hypothetical protein CK203_055775 [Vitis vinifera]